MREYVLVAKGKDGQIKAVVTPHDPLNPGFTEEELLNRFSVIEVQLCPVVTLTEFLASN